MRVPVVCSCGQRLAVSSEWVGKSVRCPVCQGVFAVTPAGAETPAAPPTVSHVAATPAADVVRAVKAPAAGPDDFATVSQPGMLPKENRSGPASAESASESLAIPGYEVLGELGRGGMGVVYRARQLGLNRIVALKMVLDGAHAGPSQLARFRAEAEAIARLRHAHIVQIYEVGERGGRPFFSLEYVEGGSLDRKVRGTPLPPRAAAALVEQLARAMHAAHRAGIVHRDLKPANVLLTADGTPKITDFGLAKDLGGDSGQTATGAVMGTPSYMAPEQAAGKIAQIGPPTDVYALGAILYELLTGRPPFKGASVLDTLAQVLGDEPVPPSRLARKVPPDLETICLKCLRKERGHRYRSAGSLADDLRRFRAGEPIQARPVGTAERAVKWVRRRPAVAALLAGMAFITFVGVAGILWKWREAEGEKRIAQEQTVAAQAAEARADEAARRASAERDQKDRELTRAEGLVYAGQLALAQQLWKEDRPKAAAARNLLDACRWDLRGFEHALLRQHFDETHLTFRLDPGADVALPQTAVSADGVRLATASDATGQVVVWDTRTGQRLLALKLPPGGRCISLSPDGERLAVAVSFRSDAPPRRVVRAELKAWDVRSGKALFTISRETPDPGIDAIGFLAGGKQLVSVHADRTVQVLSADRGEEVRAFKASPGRTTLSPDGRLLACLAGAEPSKVWDVATGRELCSFQADKVSAQVQPFFGAGGRLLVYQQSGNNRTELIIRDPATGQVRHALNWGNRYAAQFAGLSHDGKFLATAGYIDRAPKLWELATGRELFTLTGHTNSVDAFGFSPDGKYLASGGFDEMVRVWDLATGREAFSLRGHSSPVGEVFFLGDGRRLVSAGRADGLVKLWDLSADQRHLLAPSPVLFFQHNAVMSLSADGRRYVWAPTAEARSESANINGFTPQWVGGLTTKTHDLKINDAASGDELRTLVGHRNIVRTVHFSHDGRHVVSGADADAPDRPGELKVWDAATGRVQFSLEGHAGSVRGVRFSPDDRTIAAGTDLFTARPVGKQYYLTTRKSVGGQVTTWDAASGRKLQTFQGHQAGVTSIAYSPDGKLLASGGYDLTVRVWNTATGQAVRTLAGHQGSIYDVCFSADGRRIASAGGVPAPASNSRYVSGEVIVWDAATGRELLTLRGHTAQVWAVCFSPDGRRLASASRDGTVKLWDAVTGQDLLTLDGFSPYSASICFSPDGQRLIYPAGNTVMVWEAATGEERLALENYPTDVRSVGFSAGGERLVVRTNRGRVRAWDARSGREVVPCTDAPPAEDVREAVSRDGTLRVATDGVQVRVTRVGEDRPASDAAFARRTSDGRLGRSWHRRVADLSEGARAWSTAAFHLRTLVAAGEPDAQQLRERLKRCEAQLPRP